LVRTLDQLDAVLAWRSELRPAMVYCDFEDIRRYKEAVARSRAADMPVALATLRVIKPHEEGLLKQVVDCRPDALLVRNLAAVSYFQEIAPKLPLIGDYSLNVANELTAAIFADAGLVRLVPSYDLNWKQMAAMLARSNPALFECVIHQHMPMFHMEHCVFAHTLSSGKDYRDCGRPCERHQVDLRDRVGEPHPLIPDVGCRNTVYNAQAQAAAEFIPEMKRLGIGNFRVELLREKQHEVAPLLERYANVLLGKSDAKSTMRSLRVLNQLGVTRGTLDRE
jgi:putative protease